MKALASVLLIVLLTSGCVGRRVVAEPDQVSGLNDADWTIVSEPAPAGKEGRP
jgi:PBP1b-binding outer membrane lipoprotein LpoB